MTIIGIVIVVLLLIGLKYCDGTNSAYIRYEGITIDKKKVYKREYLPNIHCDMVSTITPFVKVDGKEYVIQTFFSSCSGTLFISENFEYISLYDAVEEGIISGDSVLDYDWPFEYYETHDLLNDIAIDYIVLENQDKSESVVIDDEDTITMLQEASESIYYHFLIGYEDTSNDRLDGYITIVDTGGATYEFEVNYHYIYYPEKDSTQNSGELLWLFQEHFDTPYN